MSGTPADRAAALSARIHRRFNHEGNVMNRVDFDGLEPGEENLFWRAFDGEDFQWLFDVAPFVAPMARLGRELRDIVAGNREAPR